MPRASSGWCLRHRIFGGIVEQMNAAGRQKQPWQHKPPGRLGHSPALTWLFLAGLLPDHASHGARARLRFTKYNHYRTEGDRENPDKKCEEDQSCSSAVASALLRLEEEALVDARPV